MTALAKLEPFVLAENCTDEELIEAIGQRQSMKKAWDAYYASVTEAIIGALRMRPGKSLDVPNSTVRWYVRTEKPKSMVGNRIVMDAILKHHGGDFAAAWDALAVVLSDAQGTFKSSAVRTLLGDEAADALTVETPRDTLETGKAKKPALASINTKYLDT